MKVCLLVHRWFAKGTDGKAEGAGWSCHPDLKGRLFECQNALTSHLGGSPGPVGPLPVKSQSLVLVGLRMLDPDREVDDRGRQVVVCCIAAFPGTPADESLGDVHEILKTVPLPLQQGTDPNLEMDWPGPLAPLPGGPPTERPCRPANRPSHAVGISWIAPAGGLIAAVLLVVCAVLYWKWPANRAKDLEQVPDSAFLNNQQGVDNAIQAKSREFNNLIDNEIPKHTDAAGLAKYLAGTEKKLQSFVAVDQRNKIFLVFVNRCTVLRNNGSIIDFAKLAAVGDAVSQAKARIELLGRAALLLKPTVDTVNASKAEWSEIERLRYGRVRYCWEALGKKLGEGKTGEKWEKEFDAVRDSCRDYFKPLARATESENEAGVERVKEWQHQIGKLTHYHFEITYPNTFEVASKDGDGGWKVARPTTREKFTATSISSMKPRILAQDRPIIYLIKVKRKKTNDEGELYWVIGKPMTVVEFGNDKIQVRLEEELKKKLALPSLGPVSKQ